MQAESVFAAVSVLGITSDEYPTVDNEDKGGGSEIFRGPFVDADIWRGMKEETLLDLQNQSSKSDKSNNATATS